MNVKVGDRFKLKGANLIYTALDYDPHRKKVSCSYIDSLGVVGYTEVNYEYLIIGIMDGYIIHLGETGKPIKKLKKWDIN